MKAYLNDYASPDLPEVWNWVPNDPGDVYYYLELTIGEDSNGGGDLFGLTVSTPAALSMRMKTSGAEHLSGRHHLIVFQYSWNTVLQFVNDVIDKCHGENWNDVAFKLARHFKWEFEDYVVDADIVN